MHRSVSALAIVCALALPSIAYGDGANASRAGPQGKAQFSSPGVKIRLKSVTIDGKQAMGRPVQDPGPDGGDPASASMLATDGLEVETYSDHSGCVTLFVREVTAEFFTHWLELKGQMAGCSRGYLHLHTYVNYGGSLYADGESNDCANSTECSTIWTDRISPTRTGTYVTYAHGWNTTTGGSTYVRLYFEYIIV